MRATGGKILFQTVAAAMERAGIEYREDDSAGMLVWFDTLKDQDYFSNLKPFQIVNRIPQINMICRKAPFVRIIQRLQPVFPELFDFLPQSFILPINNTQFCQAVNKHNKKYIVKPDNGSLGMGITIVNPDMTWIPQMQLAVAQEYVESKLIRNTKFDMRVYVLVSQINPLKIYVYRDGIARFCSQPADADNMFSQLTNTAVNKHNPTADMSSITQRISHVFQELEAEGADIEALWKRIDRAVVLTVIATHNFILKAAHEQCPSYGIPRCFQLLGFDVLLDRDLKPYILEVNFRPSLEFDTEDEKELKIEMLSSLMKIAAPFADLQSVVASRVTQWNDKMWGSFLQHNQELIETCKKSAVDAVRASKFKRAFPLKTPENADFERVLAAVKSLSIEMASNYKIPKEMEAPVIKRLHNQCAVKPVIKKPLPRRHKSPQRPKVPLYCHPKA